MRKLVYILSPSYSGSTLLTFLLASTQKLSTIGELKATGITNPESYRCSCGELLNDCDFWKKVTTSMNEIGREFHPSDFKTQFTSQNNLIRKLFRGVVHRKSISASCSWFLHNIGPIKQNLNTILDQNEAIINIVNKAQGSDCFLDGSKDAYRLFHIVESGRWDVKVIYLVRDGRGATNSYMKHYDVDMKTAAHEWSKTHLQCSRIYEKISDENKLIIRYEDLCGDSEKWLNHIGHSFDLFQQSKPDKLSDGKAHILGNNMRVKFANEIRVDEKWKVELTPENITEFQKHSGSINQGFGYN